MGGRSPNRDGAQDDKRDAHGKPMQSESPSEPGKTGKKAPPKPQ